jgi:hypothetical protein
MPRWSVDGIVNALNVALARSEHENEAVIGMRSDMPVFNRRRSMRQFRSAIRQYLLTGFWWVYLPI